MYTTSNNQITAVTLLIDLAVQGLTATVQASAPGGRKDAKLTLQYANEIANISAKVCGTQSHPEVELSLGVGSSCMSICGITLLDSHTKCAISTKAGIGYQNENWSTAVLYG
ncbi:hypothetical protein CY35_09G027200 [Sphagnum magellanicum]|jgi:hypothetical protein|nr:hypothetical protein CY35_09G027200 [Sphagnum magellanicum]